MITQIFLLISLSLAYKSILIFRHGARDPHKWTEIDENFLWIVEPTILTEKGVKQLIQLGQSQQRSEIFDNYGDCIYEMLELQSSKSARCTSSIVSLIKGLCPNNYIQILQRFFTDYYSNYVTNQTAFDEILNSDFSDPLTLNFEIFSAPNDFLFQGQKESTCPALKAVNKAVKKSTSYKQQMTQYLNRQELDQVYSLLQECYPSKTIEKSQITLEDIDDLQDDWYCNKFEGFNFPNPDTNVQQYLSEVSSFLKYTGANSESLQHLAALSEPFKWIINQLSSSSQLSIYSGTETNIIAMLSVLTDKIELPPFASPLEIIIQGSRVFFYYNKIALKTTFCENEYYCSKTEAINYLSNYISQNIQQQCESSERNI